ncbi:hypothetical protein JCM10450v2_001217 [Rhodotorula kratochvilovae]
MVPAPRVIPPFPYADLLDHGPYHDFRDALECDGYAHGWLESFGRGYDRDDPVTHTPAHLPVSHRGGMYSSYGVHQEQWVWDIRLEPGVRQAFETLWGTKELVSSMDAATIMLPNQPPLSKDLAQWPHIDLSPWREPGFFVAQGLVNLNDNGPDDGGLLVMKGSSKLFKEFFDEHGRPPLPAEGKIDWHVFQEEERQWFLDHGCEWVKVCAEPGDLILWSSHTMHQNCPPSGSRDRVVTYVCLGPAALMTDEDKAVREYTFREGFGTSHAPFHGTFPVERRPTREDGKVDPDWKARKNPVEKTDEVKRLAGVLAY